MNARATIVLPKRSKRAKAYLEAGTREAWIVYPEERRLDVHSAHGRVESTTFPVDIAALFAP